MITNLHIENYVLIDYLDIDFKEGLNIITGETGAGKSILLGAIGLLRGARADSSAAQEGKNCVIEATFDCSKYSLKPLFEELDLEYDDNTVIRRVITSAGKSRAYINDLPVQLTQLKSVADCLIDIHSQHQTLLLGEGEFQMEVVDCVSGNLDILGDYHSAYSVYNDAKHKLNIMRDEASSAVKEEAFLRHQYSQIADAKLKPGEQEELEESQKMLANAEQIRESLFGALNLISGDDDSILVNLKNAVQYISYISDMSSKSEELYGRIESVFLEIKDIDSDLTDLAEGVSSDPHELERVESRLDLIYSLEQRNRASTVEELLDIEADLAERLELIDNSDEMLKKQEQFVKECYDKAYKLADKLHSRRESALKTIETRVLSQLSELGMSSAQLKIELSASKELLRSGYDSIRFMFSANEGGRLEKIDKVASGGEMSRLMLCLKSLMAEHKSLPTIIFDEIDTGVSGSVADKMGEIMERLGEAKQVINITHLAQVASKGNHHFFVFKLVEDGKTKTVIKKLTDNERVEQIAAMISGRGVTDAAIEQARRLLDS